MVEMWKYVSNVTTLISKGLEIEEVLKGWLNNPALQDYKDLSFLLIWGAWFAHNKMIFHEKYIPPQIYVAKSLAIYPTIISTDSKDQKQR